MDLNQITQFLEHSQDAIKLINDQSGKHFDPLIVNAFNQVIEVFLSIKEQYAN